MLQSNLIPNLACLLDTDIIIDFLRRRDYARQLLEDWSEKGLLAISALSQLEVYQGMKSGEARATNTFLDGMISIPVDVPIARQAGRIISANRVKGLTVGIGDAIIAATAIQMSVPLLTNNVAHYPFADLQVVRGLGT
jgi:predicted nucleic acid-binding protein